jgi:glycosyltransferase involved in cell wall biosynthesis
MTTITISVVIETDSIHDYDDITIADCIRAITRQTYPADQFQVIAVDGGKAPALRDLVLTAFPTATVLALPGGTKFEQKNLGASVATGEILAFVDGDCAPPADWLATIARELGNAPPNVAGVQGITRLTDGWLAPEVSALFYGVRRRNGTLWAGRLVTDNCGFRRDVFRRFAFEHPGFSTVVDTLLLRRLERAGYRMLVCEDLRMSHSFPGLATRDGLGWFFGRAYGVGYYMVRMRQIEPDLRGSALVRRAGLGWPLLFLGKCVMDLRQVWENRSRLHARFIPALPLAAIYETALFIGGVAAILRVPPPRWS